MVVSKSFNNNSISDFLRRYHVPVIGGLLLLNFIIRLFIFYNTRLFDFGDYSIYLDGINNIASGEKQYLLAGNMLFALSYIGYFIKNISGSLDYFFILNCLLGTLTSLVVCILIIKITGSCLSGILTILFHSLYTEFVVFSSVFYTTVLMIFLLSLFLLSVYFYFAGKRKAVAYTGLFSATTIFALTFFFKPELKYLPWFLLITGLFFIRKNRSFSKKILLLTFFLFPFSFFLQHSDIISHPENNVISNSFVMFGHTDYGGDGGEGAFIYPENKARYLEAAAGYFKVNDIVSPNASDYNAFHRHEIIKFITHHPFKWIGLQFTKFFRTFGVVPETTSFKVLYTGLLKGKLWLTSIIVVAPVATIILLFILFFNYLGFKKNSLTVAIPPLTDNRLPITDYRSPLTDHRLPLTDYRSPLTDHRLPLTDHRLPITSDINEKKEFLTILLLLFIYYLIATIFYGQYQERYRLPLMTIFIIPGLGYFIASFNKKQFLKRSTLIIKGFVIVLFLTVWSFQAKKAVSNKVRLNNAIEAVRTVIGGRSVIGNR